MSTEKTDAIVIRLADFSESSKVVTFWSRDFGKLSALAKGAKRLKSAFESGLDLLSQCEIVFIPKSNALAILTESKLSRRFQPLQGSLPHLYAGYYIAELLQDLTEESDPHDELMDFATQSLESLSFLDSPFLPLTWFELRILQQIGQIPDFSTCTICQKTFEKHEKVRFWSVQSGLICSQCGDSGYQSTEIVSASYELLQLMLETDLSELQKLPVTAVQKRELRKLVSASVMSVTGRRSKTLPLITSW